MICHANFDPRAHLEAHVSTVGLQKIWTIPLMPQPAMIYDLYHIYTQ